MQGTRVPSARGRVRRTVSRAVLAVLVAALVIVGLHASRSVVARGATPGTVTLQLWPAGSGRIDWSQSGAPVPTGSCDFLVGDPPTVSNAPCDVDVIPGTPVTLTAQAEQKAPPSPDVDALHDFPPLISKFVRWTSFDCGPTNPCTFTPRSDSDWIGAIFSPLELDVGIVGTTDDVQVLLPGGVPDPDFHCDVVIVGVRNCHGLYDADSSVVLKAPPSAQVAWTPGGCDQDSVNPWICTVTMTNIETFAGVSVSAEPPPEFSFIITPTVRIQLAGTGHGRVTGQGGGGRSGGLDEPLMPYDCGTVCAHDMFYQDLVALEATPDPGSHFVRWDGVCSTDLTCRFRAGSATVVRAVFDLATAPPPPPPPPPPLPPPPPPPPPIVAHVGKVRVKHHAGHRVLALPLVVDRVSHATVRLSRHTKTILSRRVTLHRGTNLLQFRLAKSLKRGRCQVSVRIVAGGQVRTLATSVSIGL